MLIYSVRNMVKLINHGLWSSVALPSPHISHLYFLRSERNGKAQHARVLLQEKYHYQFNETSAKLDLLRLANRGEGEVVAGGVVRGCKKHPMYVIDLPRYPHNLL